MKIKEDLSIPVSVVQLVENMKDHKNPTWIRDNYFNSLIKIKEFIERETNQYRNASRASSFTKKI